MKSINSGRLWIALGVGMTAAVVLLVGWPLAELFRVTAEQPDASVLLSVLVSDALSNTVVVGLLVAVGCTLAGLGGAFLTERTGVIGRRWLRLAILGPVLVPPFVSALSWARAYGPSGITDDTVGLQFPGLFGLPGVVFVIAINALPVAYLLTVAALNSRVDTDIERAARVSGAGPWKTARTVTMPLLGSAVAGVAALVFVFAINAFGIPAVLGTPAGLRTVTTRIYEDLALSARPEAFSRAILLASVLVLIALVFVLASELLLSRSNRSTNQSGPSGPSLVKRSPSNWLGYLAWGVVLLTTFLPLMALLLVSLTRGVGLAPVPANWTMSNFVEAIDGRLFSALGRSTFLAFAAATLALALGSGVAALRNRRFGRLPGLAVLLSFAVPGSTLAVAMILSYGNALRNTLLLILIAYLAKLWAVGHRAVEGSAGNVQSHHLLAARVSGASSFTSIRTVLVPMLRPALFGGWIVVFVLAFHELTMSSLLYGPGTETLAVSVLNLQQLGDVPVSSALAVILTIPLMLLVLPFFLAGRLPRRFLGAE